MNSEDTTSVIMTEQNNKDSEKSITDIELEVLDECRAECRKNWYDRIYLCYEDTGFRPSKTYAAIKGFKCYQYNSFENADYGWNNDMSKYHKLKVRHTMIPVCGWVPQMFDKYILNWKLRNMYWGGNITMCRGYNIK